MSEHISELQYIIQNVIAENGDIEGLSVVSIQGLPICSCIADENINESLISAMSAAILSVSERAAEELHRGTLMRNMIDCDAGMLIISQAGESAILVSLVKKDAGLGSCRESGARNEYPYGFLCLGKTG